MQSQGRLALLMHRFKPGVPKRYLLLAAGLAWTTAGLILGLRGMLWVIGHDSFVPVHFLIAVTLGLVFFQLVFAKVSLKHITRIHALDIVRPSLFAFFDAKGYVMMALMISLGIFLRRSHIVASEILYNFYVFMGTPLIVSALRFYYAFIRYPRLLAADGPGAATDEGLGEAD
ncbi:MAG TPA: hypothetical protein VMV83_12905 [Rectinemataceae bacterium]|nr:hypothetical protein [Rectinemataceae bacterium]